MSSMRPMENSRTRSRIRGESPRPPSGRERPTFALAPKTTERDGGGFAGGITGTTILVPSALTGDRHQFPIVIRGALWGISSADDMSVLPPDAHLGGGSPSHEGSVASVISIPRSSSPSQPRVTATRRARRAQLPQDPAWQTTRRELGRNRPPTTTSATKPIWTVSRGRRHQRAAL